MLAVLEDALEVLRRRVAARDRKTARWLHAQTERWVFSDDTAWPFSFLNICEALDLDATALRGLVRQLRVPGGTLRHGDASAGARLAG